MGSLIGRTLSHYRITAALGAGGMGEVYRATDTTLDRAVAIKVLPPEVAQDPERLARFRREAQLLAALNHPNIAAIYGLEESDSGPFLALELVEGEDLKERLAKGAIPVGEAIEIGEQVAAALEEAHNRGIVHRDLKPANVKLTPGGKVKVLDFGLAKAWGAAAGDGSSPPSGLSQSPTLALAGTMAGVILGTAAYMAPEQARGKPVDRRADIWSFGVLLWELLTGRTLFDGETVSDVMASVLTREPDLGALPAATPPAVRRLISRCLRKDPRTRLPDIGAARLELQEARDGSTAGVEAPAADTTEAVRVEGRRRRRERWAWAAVSLALAGLAGFLVVQRFTAVREPRPAAHFVLDAPEGLTFNDFNPVAVSPDGRQIVFSGSSATGTSQLWIRSLDAPGAHALAGTEGANMPFWSADGTSIGYVAGREIRRLLLAGETIQRVCVLPGGDIVGIGGATWNSSGTIVVSLGGGSGILYSVSAAGGEVKPLTVDDAARGETGHWCPQFLPDGRHILFLIGSQKAENAGLFSISLEAPAERRRILPEETRFQYVGPGYLLGVKNGVLTARPFDADRLVVTGEAVPLASPVAEWFVRDYGWFSSSSTGRVAWVSGSSRNSVQLAWIDRKGQRLGTLGEPGPYSQIVLSPDNKRVAVEVSDKDGQFDLWTVDVARGVASRLTTDAGNERDPVWSPDSQQLVFGSDAKGDQDLLRTGLQGSDTAAPLSGGVGQTRGDRDIAKSWSRAGNTLLYLTDGKERSMWAVSLDGGGPPEALLKGFQIDHPQISPDGRWLAYISTESGRYELYVEPFRRSGPKVRVSTDGGGQPKWRGDGKELFYLSAASALTAVSVREGAAGLEVGLPTVLVPAKDLQAVVQGQDYSDYAVSADGQRFLVKLPSAGNVRPAIHVLLDWPSMVKAP